ncbi:endonuclease V [Hordeum vulgare]|nr:endonuclease V [Hordeum vulgare]
MLPAAVIERQLARRCLVQNQWKWEAIPHVEDAYLVSFPLSTDLDRVDGIQMNVPSINAQLTICAWKLLVLNPANLVVHEATDFRKSDAAGEILRGNFVYFFNPEQRFLEIDFLNPHRFLDANTLEIVHEEFDVVRMQVSYIAGFLSFREAWQLVRVTIDRGFLAGITWNYLALESFLEVMV